MNKYKIKYEFTIGHRDFKGEIEEEGETEREAKRKFYSNACASNLIIIGCELIK